MNVQEQSAGGVGDVRDVTPMSAELEQQPAVDGAEGELAALRARTCAGNLLEQPRELGAGKIRIEQQAGARGDLRLMSRCAHAFAGGRRAPVLPDDGGR